MVQLEITYWRVEDRLIPIMYCGYCWSRFGNYWYLRNINDADY